MTWADVIIEPLTGFAVVMVTIFIPMLVAGIITEQQEKRKHKK